MNYIKERSSIIRSYKNDLYKNLDLEFKVNLQEIYKLYKKYSLFSRNYSKLNGYFSRKVYFLNKKKCIFIAIFRKKLLRYFVSNKQQILELLNIEICKEKEALMENKKYSFTSKIVKILRKFKIKHKKTLQEFNLELSFIDKILSKNTNFYNNLEELNKSFISLETIRKYNFNINFIVQNFFRAKHLNLLMNFMGYERLKNIYIKFLEENRNLTFEKFLIFDSSNRKILSILNFKEIYKKYKIVRELIDDILNLINDFLIDNNKGLMKICYENIEILDRICEHKKKTIGNNFIKFYDENQVKNDFLNYCLNEINKIVSEMNDLEYFREKYNNDMANRLLLSKTNLRMEELVLNILKEGNSGVFHIAQRMLSDIKSIENINNYNKYYIRYSIWPIYLNTPINEIFVVKNKQILEIEKDIVKGDNKNRIFYYSLSTVTVIIYNKKITLTLYQYLAITQEIIKITDLLEWHLKPLFNNNFLLGNINNFSINKDFNNKINYFPEYFPLESKSVEKHKIIKKETNYLYEARLMKVLKSKKSMKIEEACKIADISIIKGLKEKGYLDILDKTIKYIN